MTQQIYTNITVKRFKAFERHEPIAIDSSALAEFKKCPRAYFFRYILGYSLPGEAIYLIWGSSIHKFLEVAGNKYRQTKSKDAAVAYGLLEANKVWGETRDPKPDDKKYGWMNKENLSKTLVRIAKEWQKEKENASIEVLNNELHFTLRLPHGQWTSGKVDESIKHKGRIKVRDYKSTSKNWMWFRKSLNPSDQFIRYLWALRELTKERITEVYVDVYLLSKEAPVSIKREELLFTEGQIDQWLEDQVFWSKALDQCREDDNYPMNEKSCTFCQFYDICTSRGEANQIFMLKSKYKKQLWDNAGEIPAEEVE